MKKFKLLSSLLAVLMVISAITAVPAGAAKLDEYTSYWNFENFNVGDKSNDIFNAEDLYQYNTDMGSESGRATIKEDTDGNKAVGIGTGTGHLYFKSPTVADTGKVYIAFSAKGSSYQFAKAFFEAPRSKDNKDGKYNGSVLSIMETTVVASTTFDGALHTPEARDLETWVTIGFEIDLDADEFALTMNGKRFGPYSFNMDIKEFHGFGFYEGYVSGSGMIDNVSIICSPSGEKPDIKLFSSTVTEDETGNSVIKVAFSEEIDVNAEDISVTKCGSTDELIVSEVKSVGTEITMTLDGLLDEGFEYVITFDGYEDMETYAYIEPEIVDTKLDYFIEDFENVSSIDFTDTNNNEKTNVVTDESIQNIFETTVKLNKSETEAVNAVRLVDVEGDTNGTNASGKAIGSYAVTKIYLLDIIESDYGVETYEFDYKWYVDGNSANWFNTSTQYASLNTADGTKIFGTDRARDKWHHLRIDYDTAADTVTVTHDNASPVVYENITMDDRLSFTSSTGSNIGSISQPFKIDNYEHYVTLPTQNIKKVRYIDKDGKATGSNSIKPEITRIDITYSAAVDESSLSRITLTADGKPIDFTYDLDGKVASLSIPGMLPGNADIELGIPVNMDIVTYNVSTKAGKFEVINLDLSLNYDTVTSGGTTGAEGDTVIITADVINTASMGKTLSLIYAFYNDCELVDIGFEEVIVKNGKYTASIETAPLTTKADVDYDTVKAFVWNGLDKAASQTFAVSYPAN